jgi:acyl-CoA thioesterase-1
MKKLLILLLTLFMISKGQASTPKHILILGDSLTEGIGLNEALTYPRILEKKLKERKHNVVIINGGISGSTTASGLTRFKWHLKTKIDIIALQLGANDGLRGLDLSVSKKNLLEIIKLAQEKKIKVLLLGILMPPNYGKKYVADFEKMYAQIASSQKLSFYKFILKDVAGNPLYNLPDGIHPNKQGHQKIADNLVDFMEKNL